jgi:hypothetical protein
MSSSQFQCHRDVINDTKVRIGANGGAGIDPLDAHSGPVIFTRHGMEGRLAGKDRESQAANAADGIKYGFAR